jgi:alkyl sulfatase BDS1-like metallo-beta-lactamase superfamily hydrolase
MGYQAESGPWRNFYLTGAQELRNGVMVLPAPDTASPDTLRAMTLDLFFDYLAMRLNGPKADGKNMLINMSFTDTKQRYVLELSNGVLNHTADSQVSNADATLSLTRETLNQIISEERTLQDAVDKKAVTGNIKKFDELLSYLDDFKFWFNIVTP